MAITLNGSTGITNDGGYTGDGVSFADTTPSNTLVTTTGGNVGVGTASPTTKLTVSGQITANSGSSASAVILTSTNAGGTALNIQNNGTVNSLLGGYNSIVGSGNATDIMLSATQGVLAFGTGASSTERGRFDTSGNFLFNSGYGSVATAYGCRAWVNFNGTGTVSIRGSGNVSSITDNGTGDYTINFTNTMPDTNYTTVGTGNLSTSTSYWNRTFSAPFGQSPSTSNIRCRTGAWGPGAEDFEFTYVAVFR